MPKAPITYTRARSQGPLPQNVAADLAETEKAFRRGLRELGYAWGPAR